MSVTFLTPFNGSYRRKVQATKFLSGQCHECKHLNFIRGANFANSDMGYLEASASNGCAMCSILRQAIDFHLPKGCEIEQVSYTLEKRRSQFEYFQLNYKVQGGETLKKDFEIYRSVSKTAPRPRVSFGG